MSTNGKPDADENDGGNAERPERPETSDMKCSICLDEITDVCHTNMCKHLFCFECLRRWSAIQSFCPLCKTNFNGIHHLFTEHGLYQVYNVPVPTSDMSTNEPTLIVTGMTTRRTIYDQNMWAEPLADLDGHFRGVSSEFFRENPEQTIRVHEFIRREVFVMALIQLNETGRLLYSLHLFYNNVEEVTYLIVDLLFVYEIMEEDMVDRLHEFFGRHALHFCHEVYNFANSLYDDPVEYDRNVSYSGGIIDLSIPEVVELDSDDEENNVTTDARRTPSEVIVLDSSSDESDVEIIGIASRPFETYESSSADQPSTSTGIQHSAECYIQSSDVQTLSRTVCGKRKRHAETNTNKKMKKYIGEQQTIVGRQSCSESSSSDEEV